MNIPEKFKFYNRKCPYCGITINFINAACMDCYYTVTIPERKREKEASLKESLLTRKMIK